MSQPSTPVPFVRSPDAAARAASIGIDAGQQALLVQAEVLSQASFAPAAQAFVAGLAERFGLSRVSLGFRDRDFAVVAAISHLAPDLLRSEISRLIEAAMDEALDQAATVCLPAGEGSPPQIELAHAALLRHCGGSALTIPLAAGGELIGAVSLQRDERSGFTPTEIERCEHVVSLVGPILHLMRQNEQPWRERFKAGFTAMAGKLRAAEGRRGRLVIAAAALLVVGVMLIPMTHRVGAEARVEGAIQRALVAPTDGFLKVAHVRPGDQVVAGQVLAELVEKDLQLERRKWESQLAQQENAHATAVARADRAQAMISLARAAEVRAQMDLVDENIGRAQIQAPFDGVVIQGDLAQSIGAPVKQGDTLLTLAPAGQFRVIVEVAERDVAMIGVGQRGALALSALPWDTLPIEVARITPLARAVEGRNVFEVEAALVGTPPALRPGLRGVARIEVGAEPLLLTWTRAPLDWLRLQFWRLAG